MVEKEKKGKKEEKCVPYTELNYELTKCAK